MFHEDRTEEFLFFLQKLAELKGETADASHRTRHICYHRQPSATKRSVPSYTDRAPVHHTLLDLDIAASLPALGVMYRRLAMTVEEDLHNSTLLRELTERRKHAQDELETLQRNLANERREKERYGRILSTLPPTGEGTRGYLSTATRSWPDVDCDVWVVGRATSSLERTLTKLQNELAELAQDTNIQMETIQRDMKAQVPPPFHAAR